MEDLLIYSCEIQPLSITQCHLGLSSCFHSLITENGLEHSFFYHTRFYKHDKATHGSASPRSWANTHNSLGWAKIQGLKDSFQYKSQNRIQHTKVCLQYLHALPLANSQSCQCKSRQGVPNIQKCDLEGQTFECVTLGVEHINWWPCGSNV